MGRSVGVVRFARPPPVSGSRLVKTSEPKRLSFTLSGGIWVYRSRNERKLYGVGRCRDSGSSVTLLFSVLVVGRPVAEVVPLARVAEARSSGKACRPMAEADSFWPRSSAERLS